MPISPAQMSSLLQLHHFTLRYLSAPRRTGWVVELPAPNDPEGRKQGSVLNRRQVFPTPEDAVEAADLAIQQAASRRGAADAERLMLELERGEVYIRPRLEPDGEGGQRKVFDVYKADGTLTPITGRTSHRRAMMDAVEAKRQGQGAQAQAQGGKP